MARPQSFTLDRAVFNQTLYAQLRDFWFQGLPQNATSASYETIQRWYGVGLSPQELTAFDDECRSRFGPALEAIGPSKLQLPPNHGDSIDDAEALAAPFLNEIKEAQQMDQKTGADTLLSLILLLDQMPRNTMRDQEGLRLVYTHYDRLAYSLLRSSLALSPNPLDHELWRGRPVIKSWVLLPLMHSESLSSQELWAQKMAVFKEECEAANDIPALKYIQAGEDAEAKHLEPLRLFGRYPHRNECLGRQSTAEEIEYLKTADTFGVKQANKQEAVKNEL